MSLVLDLQQRAMDPAFRLTDVLRMARGVAAKLGVAEMAEWLKDEAEGYGEGRKIPDYRKLRGSVRLYRGLQRGWETPVTDASAETVASYSTRAITNSIAELEAFATSSDELGIEIPGLHSTVDTQSGWRMNAQKTIFFGTGQMQTVLGAVRDRVIDWAISLENQGILGEGMSFTDVEQESARSVTNQYNFHGEATVGVAGSQSGNARVTVTQT